MENAIIFKRLMQAREDMGYNRKEFSEAIGMSYRTITNYENGSREPGSGYLALVSNMCNVSVDWLLGLVDIKDKPLSSYPAGAQALVSHYLQLNSEGQELLENHARLLVNSGEYKKRFSDGAIQKEA